jgi:hypothetical protein
MMRPVILALAIGGAFAASAVAQPSRDVVLGRPSPEMKTIVRDSVSAVRTEVQSADQGLAQGMRDVIVGRGYRQHTLFCTSAAARSALIAMWRRRTTSLPDGCEISTIEFFVRGIAASTRTERPFVSEGQLHMLPGEFMAVDSATRGGARAYVFLFSEMMRVTMADGRPAPHLPDP